jgi:serine/threonine-protein kinase HipA
MGNTYLSEKDHTIPPLVDLPRLLAASDRFLADAESALDLQLLLAPGSSLGGARPKASVRDVNGRLLIAKFPSKSDELSVMLWEAVALTLAKQAGLTVSSFRIEKVMNSPILLIERFDRKDKMRIPFLSAMTMLGANDNEHHSYLEIVDALRQYGSSPKRDCQQLWRRIVFSILISNTDDHLRNHGFLYEDQKGWCLSPAYDLNPTSISVKPRILTTAINYDECSASIELALSVCAEFGLKIEQARSIAKEIAIAVSCWREVAACYGIKKIEINKIDSAFEHDDLKKALRY